MWSKYWKKIQNLFQFLLNSNLFQTKVIKKQINIQPFRKFLINLD